MKKAIITVALSAFIFSISGCESAGPKFRNVRSYSEGLAPVQATNGKWEFINDKQVWAIPPRFEDAKEFQAGKAAVKQNGRWGFINRQGRWL